MSPNAPDAVGTALARATGWILAYPTVALGTAVAVGLVLSGSTTPVTISDAGLGLLAIMGLHYRQLRAGRRIHRLMRRQLRGPEGPVGPQGATGPAGPRGPAVYLDEPTLRLIETALVNRGRLRLDDEIELLNGDRIATDGTVVPYAAESEPRP